MTKKPPQDLPPPDPARRQIVRRIGAAAMIGGAAGLAAFTFHDPKRPVRTRREIDQTIADHRVKVAPTVPKLVIARGQSPVKNVEAALQRMGGIQLFVSKGDLVLIKPNVGWDRRPEQAANTNPEVIAAPRSEALHRLRDLPEPLPGRRQGSGHGEQRRRESIAREPDPDQVVLTAVGGDVRRGGTHRTTVLTLLAIAALSTPMLADGAPRERSETTDLHLLYTGQTDGVSFGATYGAKSSIHSLWEAVTARRGLATLDRTGWVLRRDQSVLLEPGALGTAAPVDVAHRRRSPKKLVDELPYLESDHVVVFQYPPNPRLDLLALLEKQNRDVPMDPTLRRGTARLQMYRSGKGKRVLAFDRGGNEGLGRGAGDPLSWEPWWAGRGTVRLAREWGTYYVLVKLRGYGPRRAALIQSLRAKLDRSRTLLCSGGNEVNAADEMDGEQGAALRELAFEALGALRYDAILPGARELYYGVADLKEKAKKYKLPLLATNLVYKSGNEEGKPVFRRELVRTIGGVRVAVIGMVSPDVVERAYDPEGLADLKVEDPLDAAARTLTRLFDSPETRPDVVIALSNLRGRDLDRFLDAIRGVTIFAGVFSRAASVYPQVQQIDTRKRRLELIRQRSPVLEVQASWTWVGQVDARLQREDAGFEIESLTHAPRAVTADLPRAEWLHRRVMERELERRAAMEKVLLPSLDEIVGKDEALLEEIRKEPEYLYAFPKDQPTEISHKPPVWFTSRRWSTLCAHAVREATRSEVAIIRAIPSLAISTPGVVLSEYVLGWLPTEEYLFLYQLTGAQLKHLVAGELKGIAISGIDVEGERVGGRAIVDGEHYQVAVGSSVAGSGPVSRLLGSADVENAFTLEGDRVTAASKGRGVRVREIVLAVLRGLRDRHPEFDRAYRDQIRSWLVPGGKDLTPRWTLAVESLTFAFSSYANYPGQAWRDYPGVRETRAVTPSNYSLQLKGALSATYDSARIAWETRCWFELARVVSFHGESAAVLKNADDLQASTEFRLKVIGLDLGSRGQVALLPYLNATFDTEFSPTENLVTGEVYPHQKELRGSVGIVTHPPKIIDEVRVAGVVRTDFAVLQGKVDGGLLGGIRGSGSFWRARLELGATVRYFFASKLDTEDRLGLMLEGEAKLSVAITRDVSVVLGADLFLFRPKVRTITVPTDPNVPVDLTDPSTYGTIDRKTAMSLVLSAGLSFDRAWKF